MKKQAFLIGVLLVLIAEIIALIVFAVQTPNFSQDAVAVNEVVQSVTEDFNALEKHKNTTALDYVVLDESGNLIYKTKSGLSESVNAAITHRDMILDITINDTTVGKVIIYNDGAQTLQSQKHTAIIVLSVAIVISSGICIGYFVYIHFTMIRPFRKLKGFAERIAGGNLDIPLEMDRRNLFGAFTESFDIMRSELKKARIAEAQAQQSRKELVAKLSHDIKTPVASIKAVSEVGLAVATNEKEKANYTHIIGKADQINTLVTNLFSATLEELQHLTVTPTNIDSKQVKALLENADYTILAQVSTYCGKYAFPPKSANRVRLVVEELLTCIQKVGGNGNVNLTVAYEETTGKKEVILRETVCKGNIFEEEQMDELSIMIVKNCASEINYCTENNYNVLTICIKE